MAPASRGTRLVFPFGTEKYGFGAAKPLATKGLARAAGIGARMLTTRSNSNGIARRINGLG